jgi:hypothetical protein
MRTRFHAAVLPAFSAKTAVLNDLTHDDFTHAAIERVHERQPPRRRAIRLFGTVALTWAGIMSCASHGLAQTFPSGDRTPTELSSSVRQAPVSPTEPALNENAWDFNSGQDVPGFGPMTEEEAQQALKQITR